MKVKNFLLASLFLSLLLMSAMVSRSIQAYHQTHATAQLIQP
ncbi:hypothetical protein [Spirosoma profusum]|nr:hypothetical protein [Spirosoma profusum]